MQTRGGHPMYQKFSKAPERSRFPDEAKEGSKIAEHLRTHIASDEVSSEIKKVHQLNGTSQKIQSLLQKELEILHFESEKRNLFLNCGVPSLRPDLYLQIGNSGILVEVERGKTIANNMDLLDVWKCHLCARAHFLFLIVPRERVSLNEQRMQVFDRVSKRIGTFFDLEENYVNVEEVHLFGY
jgi:hypothetical protein